MTIHEDTEMIYLAKRRCEFMSIDEFIIYDFFLKQRLQKLTHDDKVDIQKLRIKLCEMLNDWIDTI